jgi:hypothetical protein
LASRAHVRRSTRAFWEFSKKKKPRKELKFRWLADIGKNWRKGIFKAAQKMKKFNKKKRTFTILGVGPESPGTGGAGLERSHGAHVTRPSVGAFCKKIRNY